MISPKSLYKVASIHANIPSRYNRPLWEHKYRLDSRASWWDLGGGVQLPNILDDNSVEYISSIWKPHIDDCFIFYAHGEETLHRLSYPFEQFKDKIFIFLKEQFHMCEE